MQQTPANNKSAPIAIKLKARWMNRSEQDIPDLSGKSPNGAAVGISTPASSASSSYEMNVVSSSSNDHDKSTSDLVVTEQQLMATEPLKMPNFENILDNLYLLKEGNKKSRESKRTTMICECTLPEDENSDAVCCGSDCLNRVLYIECGPKCRCRDRCTNRRFQKHEYASVEPFPAGAKGWGLRATAFIPKHTFVMEYVGEVVNAKQFRQRTKQYARDPEHKHHYFMALKGDEVIDATQKGNISRFINHSCEPNCETQKWTVDGRLRIGFFTISDIEEGQELTFDYRFQRYGKEAQKCFCGTPSCRGFIGGDSAPVAITQRRETKGDTSKKKEKPSRATDFEDMVFDQQLSDLLAVGSLKNVDQVVTFCRLMVRAEEISDRMQLLDILVNTNESCLRLFIDHHGCQLLWSWMVDDQRCNASWATFQLAVLNILKRLPIPHRNMVEDSRLLAIVQRWAKDPVSRAVKQKSTTPSDEDIIQALLNEMVGQVAADETPGTSEESPLLNDEPNELDQSQVSQEKEVTQLAEMLLAQWSNLKENFRIPKKNAATAEGKSGKADSVSKREESGSAKKRRRRSSSGKRDRSRSPSSNHRHKRFRTRSRSRSPRSRTRSRSRSRSRSRGRHSRYPRRSRSPSRSHRRDHHSSKWRHDSKHTPERLSSVVVVSSSEDRNKKTKEERRREFEAEVLRQQEEEKKKRLEQEMEAAGQMQPGAMPGTPAVAYGVVGGAGVYYHAPNVIGSSVPSGMITFAPAVAKAPIPVPSLAPTNAGVPMATMAALYYDGNTSKYWWQENVTKVLVYPANQEQVEAHTRGDYSTAPHFYSDPTTGLIHEVRQQPQNVTCGADDLAEVDMACDDEPYPRETRIAALKQEISALERQLEEKRAELRSLLDNDDGSSVSSLEKTVGKLPSGWKAARDKERNIYYYHRETGHTQWEFPSWDDPKPNPKSPEPAPPPKKMDRHAQKLVHKSRSHHLKRKPRPEITKRTSSDIRKHATKSSHHKPAVSVKEEKEVPPKSSKKEESEPVPAVVEEVPAEAVMPKTPPLAVGSPIVAPSASVASDTVSVPSTSNEAPNDAVMGQTPHGTTMAAADTSSEVAKKLKESFKGQVSNHVIKYLSAYRKPDCKVGKITNNEDFKHLARKLTHAVMEKELKHCQRVEDLRVTDSVLHKAKDYVKKYMAKIGSEYKRTNNSP